MFTKKLYKVSVSNDNQAINFLVNASTQWRAIQLIQRRYDPYHLNNFYYEAILCDKDYYMLSSKNIKTGKFSKNMDFIPYF